MVGPVEKVQKVLELADLYPYAGVLFIGALIVAGVLFALLWSLKNFSLRKEPKE